MNRKISHALKVNPKNGGYFEKFETRKRISLTWGINPAAVLPSGRRS